MTIHIKLFLLLAFPAFLFAEPVKLSIKDALEFADRADTGLESARIDVETSDALVREATSAALPVINLSASTGRFVIVPSSNVPANDMSIGLSISQPVWLGGRLGLALDAARVYGKISRASILATRANLKKQIVQDYYRLSLVREVLKVTQATLDQARSHSQKASQMFEVGMISEFDLLRAQTETMTLEPEVQRALQAVKLAHTNLCQRLGLPTEAEILLTDSLTSIQITQIPQEDQNYLASALSKRPEFQVLEHQKTLGEIGLKVEERSLYWPNVYFSLVYQNQSQDNHYAEMSPSNWTTSLRWGLSASVPLFNGFATEARVQKAKLGIRKTQLAEKNLQNGVSMEVVAIVTEYKRAYKTVIGQEQALKLAEKAYAISMIMFEQGLGTELDVQDIRLTENRAKLGYLQGLYDLRVAEAEFARVINNDNELNTGSTR